MAYKTIKQLGNLDGKRALVRVDINVPMKDGSVTDDTRLLAARDTVNAILAAGGTVLLLAHFGRPKGKPVPDMSLKQVVPALSKSLGRPVGFAEHGQVLPPADVILLENTRFLPGEEANDPATAKGFAALGDIYINDAFSCAHRAHASTEALAHLLPSAAGCTLGRELAALDRALGNPMRPVTAVVGGAKVSTKLDVLTNLVLKVDHLIIGGAMANSFLFAQGKNIGASLCEKEMKDTALDIMRRANVAGCKIHLPVDGVVASEFKAGAASEIKSFEKVGVSEMILDAGPKSVQMFKEVLQLSKTLVWNGPLGAFEIAPFDAATVALAQTAAELTRSGALITVAGGGDTVAALAHAGVKDGFTHISVAGGAFLEWMEGRTLPGVEALNIARPLEK